LYLGLTKYLTTKRCLSLNWAPWHEDVWGEWMYVFPHS